MPPNGMILFYNEHLVFCEFKVFIINNYVCPAPPPAPAQLHRTGFRFITATREGSHGNENRHCALT